MKEKLKKIIFLDVDGVLNAWDDDLDSRSDLHLDKLDLLRLIIKQTDAIIVLSSTWRLSNKNFRRLEHNLSTFGMIIHSVTPNLNKPRQEEIAEWLSTNKIDLSSSKIAIIDDDSDACLIGENINFFQTDWKKGLNKTITDNIIGFLNA